MPLFQDMLFFFLWLGKPNESFQFCLFVEGRILNIAIALNFLFEPLSRATSSAIRPQRDIETGASRISEHRVDDHVESSDRFNKIQITASMRDN
jgi:hypothetical protein